MNIKSLLTKTTALVITSVSSVSVFAASDAASDPAAAASIKAFKALGAQISTYSDNAWIVAVAVMSSMVGIKLFKKFVNKAT